MSLEKAKEYLNNTVPSDDLFELKLDWETKVNQLDHPFIHSIMSDFATQQTEKLREENRILYYQISSHKTHEIDLNEMIQHLKEKLKRCEEVVGQIEKCRNGNRSALNQFERIDYLLGQLKDNG